MTSLPDSARAYGHGRRRPNFDPLGVDNFPTRRDELDDMVEELCDRLVGRAGRTIRGAALASQMGLSNTRALRKLVAYARVYHRRHEIVGIPGTGYLWGEFDPGVYKAAIADATQRARCYFFIAALHRRKGAAVAAAQMVFDFMKHLPADDRQTDELAAMVQAEGATMRHVLDAMIETLSKTPDGRKALADVATRHANVLLPAELRDSAIKHLQSAEAILGGAAPVDTPPSSPSSSQSEPSSPASAA